MPWTDIFDQLGNVIFLVIFLGGLLLPLFRRRDQAERAEREQQRRGERQQHRNEVGGHGAFGFLEAGSPNYTPLAP